MNDNNVSVTMAKVRFNIEIEMEIPMSTRINDTSVRQEVTNIINDSLHGIDYWDYSEGGEPRVLATRTLQLSLNPE